MNVPITFSFPIGSALTDAQTTTPVQHTVGETVTIRKETFVIEGIVHIYNDYDRHVRTIIKLKYPDGYM